MSAFNQVDYSRVRRSAYQAPSVRIWWRSELITGRSTTRGSN